MASGALAHLEHDSLDEAQGVIRRGFPERRRDKRVKSPREGKGTDARTKRKSLDELSPERQEARRRVGLEDEEPWLHPNNPAIWDGEIE